MQHSTNVAQNDAKASDPNFLRKWRVEYRTQIGATIAISVPAIDGTDALNQIESAWNPLIHDLTLELVSVDEEVDPHAHLSAQNASLREACQAFVAWLDHEDKRCSYPDGVDRDSPSGEAIWWAWWNESQRKCDVAVSLGRAALAEGAAHV